MQRTPKKHTPSDDARAASEEITSLKKKSKHPNESRSHSYCVHLSQCLRGMTNVEDSGTCLFPANSWGLALRVGHQPSML